MALFGEKDAVIAREVHNIANSADLVSSLRTLSSLGIVASNQFMVTAFLRVTFPSWPLPACSEIASYVDCENFTVANAKRPDALIADLRAT